MGGKCVINVLNYVTFGIVKVNIFKFGIKLDLFFHETNDRSHSV